MSVTVSHADRIMCYCVLFCWLVFCSVLAVGLLEFRAANLFKATSLSEAEVSSNCDFKGTVMQLKTVFPQAVLADLSCLKVLPLLQQTLFL